MSARIERAEVFTCDVRLAVPFEHSTSGRVTALEEVYVRLTADGVSGWGEVRANCGYTTGESRGSVIGGLRALLPRLIGRDPLDRNGLVLELDAAIQANHAAKSVIDDVLHDLGGKLLGVPVHALLGGALAEVLPTNQSVGFADPAGTAEMARDYIRRGFRHLKVRVGMAPFARDVERLRIVRETAGPEVGLAIDANGTWSPRDALARLEKLAEFDLEYAEQPTTPHDLRAMAEVTARAAVPVMADESLKSVHDALRIVDVGAADMLHLKLGKLGGLTKARAIIAVAEAAGLGYMVGQMNEGALATASAIHCAAASEAPYYELYGTEGIDRDPASGLESAEGSAVVTNRPGFGIEIDESMLEWVFQV